MLTSIDVKFILDSTRLAQLRKYCPIITWILQVLQSDWFRERAVFYDLAR